MKSNKPTVAVGIMICYSLSLLWPPVPAKWTSSLSIGVRPQVAKVKTQFFQMLLVTLKELKSVENSISTTSASYWPLIRAVSLGGKPIAARN